MTLIKTLNDIYSKLDELYADVLKFCLICGSGCKTYCWLLDEEAKRLENIGVPIAVIPAPKRRIYCIDSFPRDAKGKIIAKEEIPKCRFYKNFKCLIYKHRPLVCRLYPVEIEVKNESINFILDPDCLISQTMDESSLEKFSIRIKDIVNRIHRGLLNEIFDLYKEVYKISYPIERPEERIILSFKNCPSKNGSQPHKLAKK